MPSNKQVLVNQFIYTVIGYVFMKRSSHFGLCLKAVTEPGDQD